MKSGEVWILVNGVWTTRSTNALPPPSTGGLGKMPLGTGPLGKGT